MCPVARDRYPLEIYQHNANNREPLSTCSRIQESGASICSRHKNPKTKTKRPGLFIISIIKFLIILLSGAFLGSFLEQDLLATANRISCVLSDSFAARHPAPANPLDIRRDFALRGSGAYIFPDITSPTHRPFQASIFDFLWVTPKPDVYLPSVVLEHQVTMGECWEFVGVQGHIGIYLSDSLKITDMTITSIHPQLLPIQMGQRSPRNFILWGLVGSSSLSTLSPFIPRRSPRSFTTTKHLPANIPEHDRFVPVIYGTYNITDPSASQQFTNTGPDVPSDIQTVVLEILDNWGSNTTCVYHIGVHGVASVPIAT